MTDFFDHIYPYRRHIDGERYSLAIRDALELLENFRSSAPTQYDKEHKGSPFYVMGFAAFASHDYTAASLFFDAAVTEDIRKFGATADTPALLFLRLEDTNQNVLASPIINEILTTADELISDYDVRPGTQSIKIEELRTKFLKQIISSPDSYDRVLVTAFISFIAEWKYRARLIALISQGSREPFFLYIFRGCLLYESLLKRNPRIRIRSATLGDVHNQLYKELKIPKGLDISCHDFDAEIQKNTVSMSTTESIQMTGRVRNTLAHNLAWPSISLDLNRFNLTIKNIATACLHTISTLYC